MRPWCGSIRTDDDGDDDEPADDYDYDVHADGADVLLLFAYGAGGGDDDDGESQHVLSMRAVHLQGARLVGMRCSNSAVGPPLKKNCSIVLCNIPPHYPTQLWILSQHLSQLPYSSLEPER